MNKTKKKTYNDTLACNRNIPSDLIEINCVQTKYNPTFFFSFFFFTDNTMPSVSKADIFLLVLVMTTVIITLLTTTGLVAASSVVSSLERRVSNNKSNKKQGSPNKHADGTCTMEPFLGTSQYTNCKGEETEVEIACDTTDDPATNTTPTMRLCSYSEQPVPFEDAAPPATAVGCGHRGSFDPETHLTRDHATGMCRLKFVALTNSCDAAAPVVAGDGFGVMVVVLPSTGTGPGLHTHEQNEDNNHKDNSGMLLWFSKDGGVTYYNKEDPRKTVALDGSSSRRMQFSWAIDLAIYVFSSTSNDSEDKIKCLPATGTFNGPENNSVYTAPYETCFQDGDEDYYGDEDKYCFTQSYPCGNCGDQYCTCIPNGDSWKQVYAPSYDAVNSVWLCGPPCQSAYRNE